MEPLHSVTYASGCSELAALAERWVLDIICMIAYRAETRIMPPVIEAQGKVPDSRKLFQALPTSDVNIRPEP